MLLGAPSISLEPSNKNMCPIGPGPDNIGPTGPDRKKSFLLSRLRVAVKKMKLLLSATVLSHAWHAATILRGVSMSKRQISFNDRPGLMMCTASSDETDSEGLVSPAHHSLQRTISCPSDDDIDKRAEMFIRKDLHFAVCDDRQENVDKICEKDFGLILKAKRLEGPGSICCFC
ncbi:hypothetical protein HKD37_17G046979 [Glycine soja]